MSVSDFSVRSGCESARGPDADRNAKLLIHLAWEGSLVGAYSHNDLLTLLDLLKRGKIKPLIAQRLPLEQARRAHEMLGEGGVLGKIVLLPNA